MLNDVQYALRFLRRSPGYTVAALLTLALGTGATTAIFTLLDAVLLFPLSLAEPARVVTLYTQTDAGPVSRSFGYQQYRILREHAGTGFEEVAASSSRPRAVRVTLADGTRMANAAFVSEEYFDVVGIRPAAGRAFSPDEHEPGAEPAVIVSHAFWLARLGGDSAAISRPLRIGGRTATIVGVMPRGFGGLVLGSPAELFVPLMAAPLLLPPANFYSDRMVSSNGSSYSPQSWLDITARLRAGVSRGQAEQMIAPMGAISSAGRTGPTLRLIPTQDAALPQRTKVNTTRFLTLLATVVGLVLLVGCANLAGMVLARHEERRREIAVRLALGVPRWGVVRLFSVENLVLSIGGGLASLLVAEWMLSAMTTFVIPGGVNVESLQLELTNRVLLFSVATAIFTALVVGLVPAILASRADVLAGLKTSTTGFTPNRSLARETLVAVQIAISLILILGAGLFVRSLQIALGTEVGIDAKQLAYANVSFSAAAYDKDSIARFSEEIVRRLEAMPGIDGATMGDLPLANRSGSNQIFTVDGVERTFSDTLQFSCGPGYFGITGIQISSGRAFGEHDREGSLPVVIVNEAFARQAWPGGSPLGRRVSFLPFRHDVEVVGVARDGKYLDLQDEGRLAMYLPQAQNPDWPQSTGTVIVRTSSPTGAAAMLRGEIRAIDPLLPITRSATLESRIDDLAMTQRIGASLLGWFSTVALALAVVGVYGLVAHAVARRTREIGIRTALGADQRGIVRLMMTRSLPPVAWGVGMGLVGAYLLSRFAGHFLHGVSSHDPMIFAVATLCLCTAAVVATYIPAKRAARIAPVTALRTE